MTEPLHPPIPAAESSSRPPGLKGPRAEVVSTLKRTGALSAKAVAGSLGLSLNAVRHHLKELEILGLVRYERANRGVGAPTFVYRLTQAGESLFPQRYDDAVSRLLDHVVEREGRAAAVQVLEERYHEIAERLGSALAGAPTEKRLEIVARALADEGYMPEVPPAGATGLRLVEHNCPIQQVALRFPEVCEAEARFLAKVLNAEVTREAHIASGCSSCEYQLGPVVTLHRESGS